MNSLRKNLLLKAKNDFQTLSKQSKYKARIYKSIDLLIKIVISLGGAIITYLSDPKNEESSKETVILNLIRAFGIIITAFTALSSLFTFEKRSLSHIQIHTKCETILPEIEEKIDADSTENVREYIKSLYKDLAQLSLASFTDAVSHRFIKNAE